MHSDVLNTADTPDIAHRRSASVTDKMASLLWPEGAAVDVTVDLSTDPTTPEKFLAAPNRDPTSAYVAAEPVRVRRFVRPKDPMPSSSFVALKRWEGVITKLTPTEVEASIEALDDELAPSEYVVFDRGEIPSGDEDILGVGAVFYWSIGYRRSEDTGQTDRVSSIRLRRLPPLSRPARRSIDEKLSQLRTLMGGA